MNNQLLAQLHSPDPTQRRQAIIALGRACDPADLRALAQVYRSDPDPALRELARKAGVHIRQQAQGRTKALDTTDSPSPLAEKKSGGEVELPPPVSKRQAERAKSYYNRALDLHMAGDTAKAATELGRALAINPFLATDTPTMNLAAKMTGLPPGEAIQALMDRQQRAKVVETQAKAAPRKPAIPTHPYRWVALIVALIALAVAVYHFFSSGSFDRYRLAYQIRQWQDSVRHLGVAPNTEYYLIAPRGEPPAGGWPVVVALHGYGGRGADMLPLADTFVSQGVLFVAPSFGEYYPSWGSGPVDALAAILDEVRTLYPVHPRGAVLFGFSRGGMFAHAYAYHYPHDVAGVSAAAAPEFAEPAPGYYIPYVITYGANDGLQNYTMPAIDNLRALGFDVTFEIVPDAGHEITPRSIELTLALVRRVYDDG